MKKLFTYLSIFIVAVQFGCTTPNKIVKGPPPVIIDTATFIDNDISNFILPYKEALDKEMNEVLVYSADEFPKERGKPETKLGNLVADLSFEIGSKMYGDSIDFCLLNFGGLRTSLPKGTITRGKIFELMPFENELVVVTITKDSLKSLIFYLKAVGGQPISNNMKLDLSGKEIQLEDGLFPNQNVKVITSDYLANGGDKMTFFANPVNIEPVGIKLRDAIIQYCIQENQKGNQLRGILDNRISFDKTTPFPIPTKKDEIIINE